MAFKDYIENKPVIETDRLILKALGIFGHGCS